MPLNQFKTQVLLLHSEQSTLDTLSSGFGDRYTVHCATSGSEALNTLTETPINIIVTAQELPGMSGLEALREAKKRSPDTIGILLAGNSGQGLEALVGAEEVFQIVRGNVTTDSIKKLVDNATQQMRLMALAESANDTAANVDEPSEHIVMETSENGSTIISGGTGRMPALNPEKVSAAAAVGAQSVDVLVLTKDQEFLTTIKESSRGMHTVHYANTLKQADELIREHQVGVAVVDAAMVGEKVEQLTQHLRMGSARLVSIVAGRRDDGEMLMDLINRGKVYRFLLKPVSPGRARLAVESSVKHHLEAPDAAFKIKSGPAPVKPAAAPPPKPAAKTTPAPAPKAQPKPAAKPAPKAKVEAAKPKPASKPAPATTPAPADPPLGNLASDSPVNEGLSSAFGDDDSSFTETMTGLISTVTKKFSGDKEATPKTEPAVSTSETLLNLESPVGADSSGGSLFGNPKVIGIAAAAVMVVAAGLFWFMSGSNETAPVEEAVTTSTPSITQDDADVVATDPDSDVAALIDEARLARDAGQLFNPAGSNALELYVAAVQADPSNATLAAELDAVVGQALGMAETALLEANLDDASAALQRVAMADPDNARLPFMSAQLKQMQLRGHLADARAAIRDKRFEDAANALAAARALVGTSDEPEVYAVAAELRSSRSEQRADEVLALATARLEEGDLLAPANDNARYYYELVLSTDPQNTSARQGLNIVASRLVLQARAEIDAGNLDAAEGLLADARAIDASSSDLGATDTALIAARDAVAASERRALERRRQQEADRIAAEQKAEEERQAAAELAAQQAAAEAAAEAAAQDTASQDTAPEETPRETVADEAAADEAVADEAVAEPVAAEAQVESEAGAGADTEQAAAEPAAAEPAQRAPVAISSLNRVKYVSPKYPRAAQRRGDSGWVDIVFTVGVDGAVSNVEVRKADPEGVFDSAAIRAVEKWKFEPVSEDGILVEVRAGVRMMFALEN